MTFEQLENETDKAYAAFRNYLALEKPRSFISVARKLGLTSALMTKWSQRFDWINRAAAYDASQQGGWAPPASAPKPPPPSTDSHPHSLSQPSILNLHTALPFTADPNESNKAFESFLCYFDLGVNRSFVQVSKQMQVPLGSVKLWSRRYQWNQRVQAYNTHLLKTRVAVSTASREKIATLWEQRTITYKEREWAVTEKLLATAERVLDSFSDRDPSEISLSEVSRALEVASKIGRLSTGLATEKTEVTGENGGPVRVEVSLALEKIYGEPLPGEVVDVEAKKIEDVK